MNKLYSLVFFLIYSINSFSQNKEYSNKIFKGFTLEKFPIHYFHAPKSSNKSIEERNKYNGKLQLYYEVNEFGQQDGFKLIMDNNGIFPKNIYYFQNGITIYSASFFDDSKIIQSITNRNLNDELDGYDIFRQLKSTGGYTEKSTKYVNSKMVELNNVKLENKLFFKNNLLDGSFQILGESNEIGDGIIYGEAHNGKLIKAKLLNISTLNSKEFIIKGDSMYITTFATENNDFAEKEELIVRNQPLFSNDRSKIEKFGFNGFPYYYLNGNFDFEKIIKIMKYYQPAPLEKKISASNNLIDGDFQIRVYPNGYTEGYNKIIDFKGVFKQGIVLNLEEISYEFDNQTNDSTNCKINIFRKNENTYEFVESIFNYKTPINTSPNRRLRNDELSELSFTHKKTTTTTQGSIVNSFVITLNKERNDKETDTDVYIDKAEFKSESGEFEYNELYNNEYKDGFIYLDLSKFNVINYSKLLSIKRKKE